MKKYIYSTIAVILCYQSILAQDNKVASPDTSKLPFTISETKRLCAEDCKNKKEGTYFTAIPDISQDPVNGFGYGVEGSIYFNGKRTDPFFEYTPYRTKLDIVLFNSTKAQREFAFKFNVPYIFNTKWRLRTEGKYEVNPNLLYFGLTEQSLDKLVHPNSGKTYNNYSDYSNALEEIRKG
jgi:hypothetical protein